MLLTALYSILFILCVYCFFHRMSPLKKKKKEDETASGGYNPQYGVIRFDVDKVSSLDDNGQFSHEVEAGGVPWRANVCRSEDSKYLRVFLCNLHCQSMKWSIDVKADCILVNADNNNNVVKTRTLQFSADHCIWGGSQLPWSDLFEEEEGFLKDDKIAVEIAFSITQMRGVRVAPAIDFTDANEPSNDVTLLIEGQKIHVSKQILSIHSPVFKAMFYGNFDEKNKKEIELKQVDRVEFLELLQFIYPCCKKVTNDKAEFLLKLADRFEIACVIDRAEECLATSTRISTIEKLRLADKYRLEGLMDNCLSALTTTQDFKEVKESPYFADLSGVTKGVLFERMVESVV